MNLDNGGGEGCRSAGSFITREVRAVSTSQANLAIDNSLVVDTCSNVFSTCTEDLDKIRADEAI
jgi:hypothetical protein